MPAWPAALSLYSALEDLGALVLAGGDWEDDSLACLLQRQRHQMYSFAVSPAAGQGPNSSSGAADQALVPRKRVVLNTPGNQIIGGLFLNQVRGSCVGCCASGACTGDS